MFELLRIYKEAVSEKLKSVKGNLYVFLRWSIIAILVGISLGAFSTAFGHCINLATEFRGESYEMIYFLPVAGVCIVYLYRACNYEKNK